MRCCNVRPNDANKNWLDTRIEAYLDGELTDEEQQRFERLLEDDASSQQELTWAISIRDELRAIPEPAYPRHLEKAIMNEVLQDARSGYWTRFLSGLGALFLPGSMLKPALATGMLLVLAMSLVFIINRPNIPVPEPEAISQAEVEQALEEAKWALGYVSKTGRLTGSSMQDALAPLLKDQTNE